MKENEERRNEGKKKECWRRIKGEERGEKGKKTQWKSSWERTEKKKAEWEWKEKSKEEKEEGKKQWKSNWERKNNKLKENESKRGRKRKGKKTENQAEKEQKKKSWQRMKRKKIIFKMSKGNFFWFCLVSLFNGKSIFMGYLIPNLSLKKFSNDTV